MSLFFNQLLLQPHRFYSEQNGQKKWSLTPLPHNKGGDFFRTLAINHHAVIFEYRMHRAWFKQVKSKTEAQLKTALAMAELLAHLYSTYLNIPSEARQLRKHQQWYRAQLRTYDYNFPDHTDESDRIPPPPLRSLSQDIRKTTIAINWPRLVIIRSRRLLTELAALLPKTSPLSGLIYKMNRIVAPLFAYAAWIFFIPRLSNHLFLMIKHIFSHRWMSSEERDLGWRTRLSIQLSRRWFDLTRDSFWGITGLIQCFVLIGRLAPIGIYFTMALQALDLIFFSLRASIEIGRLNKLKAYYLSSSCTETPDQMNNHLQKIKQQTTFEIKRLCFSLTSASTLFIAIGLLIPALAFNSIFAIIGAAITVLATFAFYLATKSLEKKPPTSSLIPTPTPTSISTPTSIHHGFFKPPSQPTAESSPKSPHHINLILSGSTIFDTSQP